MELTFVAGEHLNIDAGFFAGIWKVHSKWLTWAGAHEQAFCEEDGSGIFSCDHAVLQLWDIMISQLIATGKHPRIATEERWLKSMARIRLSQMPRSVACRSTQKKGELVVTWESTDSHMHKNKTVRVTYHRGSREQVEMLGKQCLNHDDSVDSGSRTATVKPIDPRSNYQPPSVSEDDEMEENGSLYQPPSRSSSPSLPTATPAPPAPRAPPSPRPPPERSNTARVDLTDRSKKTSYVPGTKLEHKSLDWGGSFPGSHDFYRTREHPDQDIYILKPKVGTKKPRHKRVLSGGMDRGSAKRSRTSMVASQADASSYIVIPSSDSEEDPDSRATRGSPFVRGSQATATPWPEGGVTYRY
ncbi:hypothetical protein J4E86_005182 [Alternaria arbusti]|uniref:uncharacterized protein n=1 Tax=Alternaria arbusti TaxID=232088 RepID=UPI002220F1CB|nr:uncharacterized protein J4E86_005182 [Alternaria arbusti]KAI4956712.1 hypothetical protein J4E86_005182 [Alternaria arbusti]